MSHFRCRECGAYCFDTETGFITGCIHNRPDREPTEAEKVEMGLDRDAEGIWFSPGLESEDERSS